MKLTTKQLIIILILLLFALFVVQLYVNKKKHGNASIMPMFGGGRKKKVPPKIKKEDLELQDEITKPKGGSESKIEDVIQNTYNKIRFPGVTVLTNFDLRTIPLSSFVWTEKTDGLRTQLIILGDKVYDKKGTLLISLNKPFELTILDTELLNEKYYVFDGCYVNGNNIINKTFNDRYNDVIDFVSKSGTSKIVIKSYQPVKSMADVMEFIQETVSPVTKNNIDGAILQRTDLPFTSSGAYKVKRPVMNTIDLKLRYVPDKGCFFLYARLDFYYFTCLLNRLPKINRYSFQHTGVDLKRTPLPKQFFALFSSPFLLHAYLFKPRESWSRKGYKKEEIITINALMKDIMETPMKYDNTIVELSMANDGWVPYRVREDKRYPNAYFVCESIGELLFSPINVNENRYFSNKIEHSELTTKYHIVNKLIRRKMFDYLFEKYKSQNVLDIAGGRGGDSKYFIEHKVNCIFAIDADTEALVGYKHRLDKMHCKTLSFNAFAYTLTDQLEPLSEQIVKRYEYPEEKFNLAVMNYAIHYICEKNSSRRNLEALSRFIQKHVSPNGVFMFTYFDGDKMLHDAVDDVLTLHSFTIKINRESMIVNMPLPTIDESGYRDEPLVTKDTLQPLNYTVLDDFSPVEKYINDLKPLDETMDVLDFSRYIRCIICKINPIADL